jgi:hypothetical protein
LGEAIGQKVAMAERESSTTHRRAAPIRVSVRATIVAVDVPAAASASWKAYSEEPSAERTH